MSPFAPFQAINREAIWVALFSWLNSRLTAPPWAPDTVYAQGAVITDPQGYLQKALNSGTSGLTAPTSWNHAGGDTTDGTGLTAITWQNTGAGFVSIGRRHKPPPDLGLAEQPALFVLGVKETQQPRSGPFSGMPSKLILHGYLILYLQAPIIDFDLGQETVLGATQLNQLLYAIDQSLLPDNPATGKFTIGGLVTHCWIEGDSDLDPGILGSQAAALLRLHMLVP